MPDLSALHGEDQARCRIAHVDQIQQIDIELKTLAEEMPEHGSWWREIAVVWPDRHGGTADDDRKTGRRGLHRAPFRKHFRARIGTRHVVGGQQRIIGNGVF